MEKFDEIKIEKNHNSFEKNIGKLHKDFLKPRIDQTIALADSLDGIRTKMKDYLEVDELPNTDFIMRDGVKLIDEMYNGKLLDGDITRGLKQISEMKIHPDYRDINLRQQAGFSAEVISTFKDNMLASIKNTGIMTYRADDRPDLFAKNDQYVDKIRVDKYGKIIERIQSKFVALGKTPEECLNKLMSKSFDKYFYGDKVDKVEIAKNQYPGVKKAIAKRINSLQKQLKHVEKNSPAAEAIKAKIDRLKTRDKKLSPSSCTEKEAMDARINPKKYVAKEILSSSAFYGAESAAISAWFTLVTSSYDSFKKVLRGEQNIKDAFKNIAGKTAKSGAIGGGVGFASSALSEAAQLSSNELIQTSGKLGIPGMIIRIGLNSMDSIISFKKGEIDGSTLEYDLEKNISGAIGGYAGAILAAGAVEVVGAPTGPVGIAASIGAGIAGNEVGTKVGEKAYEVAVSTGLYEAGKKASKAALVGALMGPLAPVGAVAVSNVGIGLVGAIVGYSATSLTHKAAIVAGSKEAGELKKAMENIKREALGYAEVIDKNKKVFIEKAFNDFDRSIDEMNFASA